MYILGSLSCLSCFGCFQCNICVYVMNLHLFHNNPLLSVSWGEMRFWVFLEEKNSLSKFSDERLSFVRNWAKNEDVMLWGQFLYKNVHKLGSISYSSCFGCFQCKRCVSAMNLHLFHNNPLLSVSWGEMHFWVFL